MNDVMEWMVFNIETLAHDYYSMLSFSSFNDYVRACAVIDMGHLYNTEEILLVFDDERINNLIEFYEKDKNETDKIYQS